MSNAIGPAFNLFGGTIFDVASIACPSQDDPPSPATTYAWAVMIDANGIGVIAAVFIFDVSAHEFCAPL
jgi:hypothetical protein